MRTYTSEKLKNIAESFLSEECTLASIILITIICQWFTFVLYLPSMVIMSGISAFGSVLGSTWRNQRILGSTWECWKTSVTDAVLSRTKLLTTRRRGRNSVILRRRPPSETAGCSDI